MRSGIIFSLIFATGAVIFALANPQPMEVDFLLFRTSGSTALVLIVTFGFGVVVGLLSTLPTLVRKRRQLKSLQKNQNSDASPRSSVPNPKSSSGSSNTADTS